MISCDFCEKTESEVFNIIEIPEAYICSECAVLATELIKKASERNKSKAWSPKDLGADGFYWYEPADKNSTLVDKNGKIIAWLDKSGNGKHFYLRNYKKKENKA